MPCFGLPQILEQTINNIFLESKLASYKIAGNGPRTTIVLLFDANMADASVSPMHQSTPQGCYLQKFPRPEEKRAEKGYSDRSTYQEKELTTRTAVFQDSAKSQPRSRSMETTAPSILRVIWIQQTKQGDRQNKTRDCKKKDPTSPPPPPPQKKKKRKKKSTN